MAVVNRRIEEKIERRKMAKKAEIIKAETIIIEPAQIQDMIHVIRGQRVILDSDLARLYGVETKQLKRQVRRNITRFPSDFMFELTREEYNLLRCQNGTIENGRGEYSKYLPFAFTENGVAMLSSVLTSELAVQTNIQIMRAFVFLKNSLAAIDKTTLQQEKLELEIEKLRLYVEEILKDQNDTNEELHQQIENLQLSLTELGAQVDYLNQKPDKKEPLPKVGYQAIWERDHGSDK